MIRWSLSVVSHGHQDSVDRLLADLSEVLDPAAHEILLTRNIPEACGHWDNPWPGLFREINNSSPKGFAANHNAALKMARGPYVAAIDPDLRFSSDPFAMLSRALDDPGVGIVSTRVVDEQHRVVDHARQVPTPPRLLRRYLNPRQEPYPIDTEHALPQDWIAGLFMALRAETFSQLRGFDERFHMYCEDVDLCVRAWNAGLSVKVVPAAAVQHVARRQTLKHGRHFAWHCRSMLRLWTSDAFRRFSRSPGTRPSLLE